MNESTQAILNLSQLREKRAAILSIAHQYGVSYIRVFGSVARDEATPESDVDLLVTMPDGASIFDMVGLWLDLKELLQCEVSLVSDQVNDTPFLEQIEKGAIFL